MRFFKAFIYKVFVIGCLNLLIAHSVYAQSGTSMLSNDNITMYIVLSLVCLVALTVLLASIYILRVLKVMIQDHVKSKAEGLGQVYIKPPSIWEQINQKLTNAVPLEQESTIILNHDYDGIKELDNHLPPWWTYLFYTTAVFAVVYMFIYHVSGSMPLQTAEYNMEIALAAEIKAQNRSETKSDIDEANVTLSDNPSDLKKGAKIYQQQCAACHKSQGEGGIGPNLTDDYWLHGGSFKEIFATIKYGVPDKGMISWKPLLSPVQMRAVASYIKTLKGSNPPNAKAPQGELYEEVIEASVAKTDSTTIK